MIIAASKITLATISLGFHFIVSYLLNLLLQYLLMLTIQVFYTEAVDLALTTLDQGERRRWYRALLPAPDQDQGWCGPYCRYIGEGLYRGEGSSDPAKEGSRSR